MESQTLRNLIVMINRDVFIYKYMSTVLWAYIEESNYLLGGMKKCPPTRKSGLFLILEFTLNLILDEY
jgi:hypothetical protein